jgi:hypothetical protein
VNEILDQLLAQANAALSVVSAVASNKPAPARQVVIYTLVLIALAFVVPKIVKLVSK